ncbi:MAG: polyphosphate kinase 2 family protein [Proteobacteria bacterium]|nr:polyphosphate kinase 2 family protein [Pseudomonadota bacterium]
MAKKSKIRTEADVLAIDTEELDRLVKSFRVTDGEGFDPDDYPTRNPMGKALDERAEAKALLSDGIAQLSKLQEKLYAQDKWSVLVIFQAMDAAGKDSTIKHVLSGINPQGCEVTPFKRPSDEELSHDFLWRCLRRLPERGRIGIFNRSHYEEVLVVRVHPEILAAQHLPDEIKKDDEIFDKRLKDIRHFENYLARNGTKIIKFFLHVSKDEQKKRLLSRLDEPDKNWKFELGDLKERALWDDYQKAYKHAIRETATKKAPWYVIPADDKWFMRAAVVRALLKELNTLDLEFPEVSKSERAAFAEARKQLESE